MWGVIEPKPEENQSPESSENIPENVQEINDLLSEAGAGIVAKNIEEIDDLLSEAGAGHLPLTADVKSANGTDSVTKVNPFNIFTSIN